IALFFLAFLPQFVNPNTGLGALPFLLLGILFAIGGTIWCLMLAGSAAIATHAIQGNRQCSTWLQRVSGGVYIGLGLHLLRSKFQSQ
ncbi:MAG TPA: LysE family transporter, partial [Candidatus Obscuribacterales bacterium]